MRILFVMLRALEVNSSVTISNLGLLKGLKELDYEIDLVMPSVKNTRKENSNIEESLEGINVIRIPGNSSYNRLVEKNTNYVKKKFINMARKLFYKVSMHDNSVMLIKKADIKMLNYENYDLIISTSDPKTSHLFVKKLIDQGLSYTSWLQHWGDPLSLDITKRTIFPQFYLKYKEREILSWADKVVYVSPLTEKLQKKIFSEISWKIHFVPLPYENIRHYPTTKNMKFKIGYFGDYNSEIRNISPLYNFCVENPDIELVIAGHSDIKLEKKDNITILPRIDQLKIIDLEAECDLLVCICNNKGTQIPGKIYYYTATNKPILVILDGNYEKEIASFLSNYNRFNICGNEIESIEEEVNKIKISTKIYSSCKEFSSSEIANEIVEIAKVKHKEIF